jgi:Ca-activated chloride channel homolog
MSEVPSPAPSGRHRRRRSRPWPRHWVRRAAGLTAGAVVLAGCGVGLALGHQSGDNCPDGVQTLSVAVTPELADIVSAVARSVDAGGAGACTHTVVAGRASSAVAASLQTARARRPDVWIPDSSSWFRHSAVGAMPLPTDATSVARSPIVVALAPSTAVRLGWGTGRVDLGPLLSGDSAGRPADLFLPDPQSSAVAAGALLSLQATAAQKSDGQAALTAALLGHVGGAVSSGSTRPFEPLLAPGATALAASEQQVWAHNRAAAPAQPVVAAYPALGASSLDYPFAILARGHQARTDADRLLAALRGRVGGDLLHAAGFRDVDGSGGPVLSSRFGVNGAIPAGPAPGADAVDRALASINTVKQGSRMLAVVDVSGSMGEPVPGTGGATKLDLTKDAARRGLGLYSDSTEVGLWAFSTHLTAHTDYRELVPIEPLGGSPGAITGRQRLAGALATLQHVPNGSTGLYDTALAATRRVRAGWQPGRVNSVVLLTDGKNEDDQGIGLAELLRRLRAEDDPSHPVPLITIAYGAQSPVGALRAMSAATGGAAYVAKDPRQVQQVFLEAIEQRACRPNCGG